MTHGKTILFLCHRIPYPPNKGDKIRSFNEIRYLSEKHTIDLITLADEPADLKYEKDLEKYCRQVKVFPLDKTRAAVNGCISLLKGQSISQGYFYKKAFQKLYNNWISTRRYDAVFCFSSPMAAYVFKGKPLAENRPRAERIMDFCDLDSDKWRQYAEKNKFPKNRIYQTESKRLLKFEKKINQVFDRSIFVSKGEADLFKSYVPSARNLEIIPNGVDYEYFCPENVNPTQEFPSPMIMFAGAMDYYANVDGVTWFAENILPEIKKRVPAVQFYIVGSNPVQAVTALEKDPAVTVTGFVKDIRKYYTSADLCVIPLKIARGVQNKVLEALAMEKPVITTAAAVQGLRPDVRTVLDIEDDTTEFAGKTVLLLEDNSKAQRQGRAARQFILDHYNWENNLNNFLPCSRSAANGPDTIKNENPPHT